MNPVNTAPAAVATAPRPLPSHNGAGTSSAAQRTTSRALDCTNHAITPIDLGLCDVAPSPTQHDSLRKANLYDDLSRLRLASLATAEGEPNAPRKGLEGKALASRVTPGRFD